MIQKSPFKSARVVAPARSEPLPGSLKNWHQVSSPVRIRRSSFFFCRSDPCSSSVAAASNRTPDLAAPIAPTLANSSSTARTSPCGRSRPYHSRGHCGMPHPESASLLRHSTSDKSGSQFAASHSRTSARTSASLILLIAQTPTLHQEFPVVTWQTEKYLRAFGALEPQMRVVVPGETDAAMNLDTFDRGMQVRFRRGSFRQAGQRGPFGIVDRGGLRRVIGSRFGQLDVEQHIGELVLDSLERAYCPPELHPQLRVIYCRFEQHLRAAHHLIGERNSRLIESTKDCIRPVIEAAQQIRMCAAKIDARDLARRIHRFKRMPLHAAGLWPEREQCQPIAADSVGDTRRYDQQIRN